MTTTISYPSSLPPVMVSGASLTLPQQTIRTQMDYGPAKVRRRTSSDVVPVAGQITISASQRDTLLEFYTTTTAGGSLPFLMTDPIRGFVAEFRFAAQPQIRPLNTRTASGYKLVAQISLEQLPPFTGIVTVSAGPTCVLLGGLAGVVQFSNVSTIALQSRAFCVNDTNGAITNEDADDLTLTYARVNTEGGENISVDWEYTDANGTSIITFHRDTGWSYTLDPDHVAEPSSSCAAGSTGYSKASGDETQFPGFRDFSQPALDDMSSRTLCATSSGLTLTPHFYRLATIATLSNGACGTPPSRAQGFRDYLWACSASGSVQQGDGGVINLPE